VILDVDGTLVNSNDAHARAWLQAFLEHGITVAYESVRCAIGMGGDKLMPLVAGTEEDSPKGKNIAARRAEVFQQVWLPKLRPFPCTRELVSRLADDGFTLAVASSASEKELKPLLDVAGVADFIPTRTSSDDAENSKPDPDIVQAAMQRTRCPRDRTIMIGDTPYDVEAALRAGIRIVAFECGGWRREELQGASEVYRDASDLLQRYNTSVFFRLTEGGRRKAEATKKAAAHLAPFFP
jgi:phosphoglycolate phosphatase-like HAD superfamily hydrolase